MNQYDHESEIAAPRHWVRLLWDSDGLPGLCGCPSTLDEAGTNPPSEQNSGVYDGL